MLERLSPIDPDNFGVSEAAHLMWRAGFGCTWEDAEEFAQAGLNDTVDRLVARENAAADPVPPSFATLPVMSDAEFNEYQRSLPDEARGQARRDRYDRERDGINALKYWWLEKMQNARNPLVEKMALFWHSHFASSFEDKIEKAFPLWQQNEFFRMNALEPFPVLMRGIIRDPAMLVWLDNASSHKDKPNENFARELMELFSMGVNRYSEEDVRACAKALTGFSVTRETWQFRFKEDAHDNDIKKFHGWTGNFSGDDAVRIICDQDVTASFITRKLLEYFLYENPSPELLTEATRVFQSYSMGMRPFLATLFKSKAFYSRESRGRIIKSPIVLALGAVKSMQVELPPAVVLLDALKVMGQDLFFPPDVNGWPGGTTWINSNTLLVRYNFANFLLYGVSPDNFRVFEHGTGPASMRRSFVESQRSEFAVDWDPAAQLASRNLDHQLTNSALVTAYYVKEFLQREVTPETTATYLEFCRTDASGGHAELTLSSNNFNERIKGLVHLIMSSPEYQLC